MVTSFALENRQHLFACGIYNNQGFDCMVLFSCRGTTFSAPFWAFDLLLGYVTATTSLPCRFRSIRKINIAKLPGSMLKCCLETNSRQPHERIFLSENALGNWSKKYISKNFVTCARGGLP